MQVYFNRPRGELEGNILAMPSWEDFDAIVEFLRDRHDATVIQEADGPDARCWVLRLGADVIKLFHEDDWGNSIVSPDLSTDELVTSLCNDVVARLQSAKDR